MENDRKSRGKTEKEENGIWHQTNCMFSHGTVDASVILVEPCDVVEGFMEDDCIGVWTSGCETKEVWHVLLGVRVGDRCILGYSVRAINSMLFVLKNPFHDIS